MAFRVVASAPTLLPKFFRRPVRCPFGVTPLSTARWLCYPCQKYSVSTSSLPQMSSVSTCSLRRKSYVYNDADGHPFLRAGELGPCSVDKTKNDYYIMRVDVPGIPEEKMILWVESGYIYFTARDYKIPNYNYDGRVFGGLISLNPEKFDSNKVKFEVRNGVLWIVVPRLKK